MGFLSRMNIRAWLLVLVLAAVLPVAGLILWSGMDYSEHLRRDALVEARRSVDSLAEVQTRLTESTRQILSTLALVPEVASGDGQTAADLLNRVLGQNPIYVNILKADREGAVRASPKPFESGSVADRKHFCEAQDTGEFSAGEFVVSRTSREPIFPFCLPLTGPDGRFQGALTVGFRLASYRQLFENLDLPKDSIFSIADHRGIRLFFLPERDSNPLGQPIHPEAWKEVQGGGDGGSFLRKGSDGIKRFYAYRKLRLAPDQPPYLVLFLGIPADQVLAPARTAVERNLRFLGLVTVLALVLAWLVGDALIGRRLRAVAAMAERIRSGDLDARLDARTYPAELRRMTESVAAMAEGLQARLREREEASAQALEALREKETLLREIHHRVKNNLQLILSLVRMQGQFPEGEAGSEALENRIRAMSLVHEQLYGSLDLADVDLAEYVPRLVGLVARAACPPPGSECGGVDVEVSADPVSLHIDQAVPFGLLLNELLTNACKHGLTRGGRLHVALRAMDGQAELRVSDSGPGLPESFDPAASPTLGAQLVVALSEQLGGTLTWTHGPGAAFTLRFPLRPGGA